MMQRYYISRKKPYHGYEPYFAKIVSQELPTALPMLPIRVRQKWWNVGKPTRQVTVQLFRFCLDALVVEICDSCHVDIKPVK